MERAVAGGPLFVFYGTFDGSQVRRTAFAHLTGDRGVAIETREDTYLFNSRTADSFLASALCGGAIGKPDFGFPRARIRDIEPNV